MVIFHSYVKLPEGIYIYGKLPIYSGCSHEKWWIFPVRKLLVFRCSITPSWHQLAGLPNHTIRYPMNNVTDLDRLTRPGKLWHNELEKSTILIHFAFWMGKSTISMAIAMENIGKSPFLMGKSTISMAMFNSYVSVPEAKACCPDDHWLCPFPWRSARGDPDLNHDH